jgi:hypothetical protein
MEYAGDRLGRTGLCGAQPRTVRQPRTLRVERRFRRRGTP